MTEKSKWPAFHPDAFLGGEDCARLFRLHVPTSGAGAPIVFNVPHSGRCYPRAFVTASPLSLEQLRATEDFAVDVLFSAAPRHGCSLMVAQRPRVWLDLNRAPNELSAEMFEPPVPSWADVESERAKAGLGVIPRQISEGVPVYGERMRWEEAWARIESAWRPYHGQLERLLRRLRMQFGAVVLIDCHSMPESAARAMTPLSLRQPDVILGDVDGSACASLLTDVLEELFAAAGLNVRRNRVYSGGYITRRYGLNGLGAHALQIELNRRLYMRPGQYELTADFARLRRVITDIVEQLPRRLAPLWRQGRAEAAE